MKRFLAVLLSLAMVFSLAACGGTKDLEAGGGSAASGSGAASGGSSAAAPDANAEYKVGVVFGPSGLGDNNFADMIYDGLCRARDELGIYFDYIEPGSDGEIITSLYEYAQDGTYDVVMLATSNAASSLEEVAAEYPDQNFTIIDATVDLPNVRSVAKIGAEQTFMAGVVAALLTQEEGFDGVNKDKKIGVVVGEDFPIPMAMAAGFKAGAYWADPEVEVLVSTVGSWSDPGAAKEMSTAMIKQGVDIIQNDAGGSGTGVFAAAEETGTLAIGVGANQNSMSDRIIGTSLFILYQYVYNECEALVNGQWTAGVVNPGLADGSLGFVTDGASIEVPQAILDKAEEAKAWVVSGGIELPTKVDGIEEWAAQNGLK